MGLLQNPLDESNFKTCDRFDPDKVSSASGYNKGVSDNANVYHIQRNFVSCIQIIHSFILLPEPNADQSEPFLLQYY